ncbi:hypothetical protein EMIHUDRAFT_122955, partial [Emiliania huxleyi CCMP1516]
VVYYSEKKPLANVKGFERRRLAPALRSNATAADLVAILKSAAAATAWQAQAAAAEACPVREWVYFSASNSSRTAQHVHSENVWLGGGGVTAFNHYDASHNAFCQLHGRTLVTALSPISLSYNVWAHDEVALAVETA